MKIREKRIAAGLTQIQLAEKVGVNQSAVAQWECGRAAPKAELLPKLAEILGCTIDALFGREASTA